MSSLTCTQSKIVTSLLAKTTVTHLSKDRIKFDVRREGTLRHRHPVTSLTATAGHHTRTIENKNLITV